MKIQSIPHKQSELMQRATSIAGYSLGEIAKSIGLTIPPNLKKQKGWVGKLIELYLGANAGSKAERDFSHLGIELKTIPVNQSGIPLETTFVSVAPLTDNHGITWESSHVKYKLNKVLWIPVEGDRATPLAIRRIGLPILWQPSKQEELQLKQDWQELMDMIVLGQIEKITARHGEYLQIRPKAANGKVLTEAFNENAELIMTRPRGFYLKKQFTAQILANYISNTK
ncbi:DNA mismatch repair endonuclease MutH [Orbus sturtevantii]|uniref:DNA mismatch repair endonuclease MutH n=1 Tax=Orbus sturtevantii TaxID=3074109 RepID=UPI00370D2D57